MEQEIPTAVRALWERWNADDRKWLTALREALLEQHAGAVTRALLFGSLARGAGNADSDIDVLVVVRDEAAAARPAIETLGCRLSLESTALGSVIAVTASEWAARAAARTRWHHDVETHGVSIL